MDRNSIFRKETRVGGTATSRTSFDFGRDEIGRICISSLFFEEHNTSEKVQTQKDNNPSLHCTSE